MAQIKDILEPLKAFETVFQNYGELVNKTFEGLQKESGVDVQKNNATCSEIYEKEARNKKAHSNRGAKKGLKIFLIIVACVAGLIGLIGILLFAVPGWRSAPLLTKLLCTILGLCVMVAMIVVVCVPLNRSLDRVNALIAELENSINELKDEAWKQMRGLNSLFTWNMPQVMITETVPLIQLDGSFQTSRANQIARLFKYVPSYDDDTSVLSIQSGSILGNPFFIEKTLSMEMGSQVYTGSIVITWTTYERDSNGNTVARHHSQTLTASVTKPKPFYDTDTYLTYFNEACPNLSFARQPIGLGDASEKQIAKFVKKEGKRIAKLSKKSVKTGGNFTAMGNKEFDALFNATDRNNEVEFRMMFTPIGQKNMIDLIKNSPYHDDFIFIKRNMVNVIRTDHAQNFDYHSDPVTYYSFDFNQCKENFTSYCLEYMRSLYFDLAPLLSVPLYQQYKSTRYIYKEDDDCTLTIQEIESLANQALYYDKISFAHPATATDVILKCVKTAGIKAGSKSVIEASSFKTIERVTIIPVRGGDGRMHDVPVHWLEYIPVSKLTNIVTGQPYKYCDWHKIKDPDDKKLDDIMGFRPKYGQKSLYITD